MLCIGQSISIGTLQGRLESNLVAELICAGNVSPAMLLLMVLLLAAVIGSAMMMGLINMIENEEIPE